MLTATIIAPYKTPAKKKFVLRVVGCSTATNNTASHLVGVNTQSPNGIRLISIRKRSGDGLRKTVTAIRHVRD